MPKRNRNTNPDQATNPIKKQYGDKPQDLFTRANAGNVTGSQANAFKQRQDKKKKDAAPKAPVVDTRSELEIKFEEYAEFLKDKAALTKRETKLKTYFTAKLLELEEKEKKNGANLYNEKKTAYFKNSITKVYEFPDTIQIEENKIQKQLDLLKNDKERAKIDGTANVVKIKKAMKYYEPKAKGDEE